MRKFFLQVLLLAVFLIPTTVLAASVQADPSEVGIGLTKSFDQNTRTYTFTVTVVYQGLEIDAHPYYLNSEEAANVEYLHLESLKEKAIKEAKMVKLGRDWNWQDPIRIQN
jgi:hypothetical protein